MPSTDFEVFTMKPDSSDVRRLTETAGADAHATWSADGKGPWFEFAQRLQERGRRSTTPLRGLRGVHLMNRDGSNAPPGDRQQVGRFRWASTCPEKMGGRVRGIEENKMTEAQVDGDGRMTRRGVMGPSRPPRLAAAGAARAASASAASPLGAGVPATVINT